MGKQIWIPLLFVLTTVLNCHVSYAQNLVSNPSFEDTTSCPVFQNEIYKATPWFNPSTSSTPDYYNTCNKSVPHNFAGYQTPRTGNAYAGFFAWETGGQEYREYIETKLTQTLIANRTYCIEFYVALSNNLMGTMSVNTIGAHFSKSKVTSINNLSLPFVPQVESPRSVFLTDSLSWMKIHGCFAAQGGEQYLTIGNFNNEANTDTFRIFSDQWGAAYGAYYYIDDVSVVEVPENNIFLPNVFSPNGDGKNDVFKIQGQNIKGSRLLIFNRWGEKVFESNDQNTGWDGNYRNGPAPLDVYFYHLTGTYSDDIPFSKKGNITLMR